ncbi:MAG: SpoIIE family protein phosphatase [Acidobacteria bacterium]|nr:SpoIIE family protein phosphatase [Acidobacteriota bacterium]
MVGLAPISAEAESSLYLAIQGVTVFVKDVRQSLHFYLDQLGLRLVYSSPEAERWTVLAASDGNATLSLVQPRPQSAEFGMIGRSRNVIFVTDDVDAQYREWSDRGVRFLGPPRAEAWGGKVTGFEDPDGNSFVLVTHDAASREMMAQRRAKEEMEIAKDVQARMFPQTVPALRTLDYAGICLQARRVGGDYYDFIDLGGKRVAMVIGDVSGKGMPAALLMASLHAILRSYRTKAFEDTESLLSSVNRFFFENTADESYVTLFFAEYDDEKLDLRFASCGHLAGLLFRSSGGIERLESTCGVLGLLGNWRCALAARQLSPGDLLAIYTDGATECFNDQGEEFGECRLIDALGRARNLPAHEAVKSVVNEISQFSREQSDDITLIVARCRAGT